MVINGFFFKDSEEKKKFNTTIYTKTIIENGTALIIAQELKFV